MRVKHLSRAAAAALILTALPGCDNVEWGGADVLVVPAPPPAGLDEGDPGDPSFSELGLPAGTVLFHVVRDSAGTRVIPVAEVSGDTLRTLRRPPSAAAAEYEASFLKSVLEKGAQIELFRRGAPVGRLTLTGAGPTTPCGVPTGTGNAITVAAAADVDEFLGFRSGLSPEVRGEYSPPQATGSIRAYASIVAERLILQAGLPRPRSWVGAQRDLQAIEVVRGGNPEMAATYLVGDRLAQGAGEDQGYSIFYLAGYETRSGYSAFYNEVRSYARTGKAAPRLVDYLDWDASGGQNVLIQVYGADRTWYEAISQTVGGRWVKSWEQASCQPETPPAR